MEHAPTVFRPPTLSSPVCVDGIRRPVIATLDVGGDGPGGAGRSIPSGAPTNRSRSAIPTIHPLVNEFVRVEARNPPKEIVGRLVSIDATELVIAVDGIHHTFQMRDLKKIQTTHPKSNRAGRWLTVAGLGGILAAFLFGQVGGY
jgi:hypothetical protein